MARGGRWQEAERHVLERIASLPEWKARNANDVQVNNRGFDLVATDDATGRQVLLSVKSVSVASARHDYAVGSTFDRHKADIYAFVDMTGESPGLTHLAGAETVVELAKARNSQYQAARDRPDALGRWSPKISRGLLELMNTREAWNLLDRAEPATWPPVTEELLHRARADAPPPRAG